MTKALIRSTVAAMALCLALSASAGTQDFTLVNQSGVLIYELYISESNNDSWEEDVLGENILDHGESLRVNFSGRSACSWDIMAVDTEGTEVYWSGIDLCSSYVVTLTCDTSGQCWATSE